MNSARYVLLVGSKNNAGDYLIRHRAIQVLTKNRPDRELVCLDRWKSLDEPALQTINDSAALLLTGGPALKQNMYPKVYPLVEDLTRIRVPIILYGVGCNDPAGEWRNSRRYPFDASTRRLLERVNSSGYASSVRDYFSLNALTSNGYGNALMTGCPALYAHSDGPKQCLAPVPAAITFSPGTSFLDDSAADGLQKDIIAKLQEEFPQAKVTVAFHHSLDPETFKKAYGKLTVRFSRQRDFAQWLKERGVTYVDLSGSHEAMVAHYSTCDLHVGFRVHAHILMASLSRPTALLAEDGRGIALRSVLGGMIFDSYRFERGTSVLRRRESKATDGAVVDDVLAAIRYEVKNGYPRSRCGHRAIEAHYDVMKAFAAQLP